MAKISELLYSEDPKDRRRAIQALGNNSDPRAADLLQSAAVNDSDPELRELAAYFLRQRGEHQRGERPQGESSPPGQGLGDKVIDMVGGWKCAFCGSTNARGFVECQNCGAPHGKSKNDGDKPKNDTLDDVYGGSVFVLNPAHRAYVDGVQDRPSFTGARMSGGCGMLFMIPFVLAGIFVIGLAVSTGVQWWQLRTVGASVDAVVTGFDTSSDDDGTTYYLLYRFEARDERSYEGRASVSSDMYRATNEGDRIRIRYLPGDPRTNRLESDISGIPVEVGFLTLFSVCWNVFVIGMFGSMLAQSGKLARLARSGQRVDGTIVNISGSEDSDGDLSVTLHYTFTSPASGATITGKSSQMRNDLKRTGRKMLPSVATPVVVWYVDERTHLVL